MEMGGRNSMTFPLDGDYGAGGKGHTQMKMHLMWITGST